MESTGSAAVPFEPELVTGEPVTTAVVRGVVGLAELREFFDVSFRELARATAEQGVPLVGPAFARYRGSGGDPVELEVGFPVGRAVRADGQVVPGSLPGGPVARVTHRGGFDGLGDSWARLEAWLRGRGLVPGAQRWESYVTRPTPDADPAQLRTELSWPVRPAAEPIIG
jgi:effector-binding domain-containing protein